MASVPRTRMSVPYFVRLVVSPLHVINLPPPPFHSFLAFPLPLVERRLGMASVYDEVEIEDMTFVEEEGMYYYPCPCGDKFQISIVGWRRPLLADRHQEDLYDGEEIARCPSCSLTIRVIYNPEDFVPPEGGPEEGLQGGDSLSLTAAGAPVSVGA